MVDSKGYAIAVINSVRHLRTIAAEAEPVRKRIRLDGLPSYRIDAGIRQLASSEFTEVACPHQRCGNGGAPYQSGLLPETFVSGEKESFVSSEGASQCRAKLIANQGGLGDFT